MIKKILNLKKIKRKHNYKYYFKNIYFINYKILLTKFHFLFNFIYINYIKLNKKLFKLKKNNKQKFLFKVQVNNYLNLKNILLKYFNKKIFYKKIVSFLFLKKKLKLLKFLPDNLPFLNLLKTNKNISIKLNNLINDYGYIYLKSSGINTFLTLTNSKGEVL